MKGTPAAVAISKWALLFGYVGAKTPIAILQYIGTWKLSKSFYYINNIIYI